MRLAVAIHDHRGNHAENRRCSSHGSADPKAKIYAFKLHTAKMPVLDGKNYVIPIMVEEFFPNGKVGEAVQQAAKLTYGVDNAQYTWVSSSRYMGIFHEVQPASHALQCLDCHGPNGRMDWSALGYKGDPLTILMSAHQ